MRAGILGLVTALTVGILAPAQAAITFDRLDAGSTRVLVLRGQFELDDDAVALVSEVTVYHPDLLTFQSPGGNIAAAMKFGRTIRALGLSTLQSRSADCASACTLAFIGGMQRYAEPGAIGVHQSSFSSELGIDSQSAVSAVQSMTAQIMTYMIEMGVDPQLLQLSLAVDSADMRYLTGSEMRRYRVTTMDEPATLSASAEPTRPQVASLPAVISSDDGSQRALAFVRRYHAAWSSTNLSAMSFMDTAYANSVLYYGKNVSAAAVLKEKQAFAKRWPIRIYSLRDGSEQVACRHSCQIEAVVDWFAKSDERGKSARGAATISIEWDPQSERIVSERSKVLRAERSSTTPQQLVAKWQDENSACRGGSGDEQSTLDACDRRTALDAKLAKLNWCYGREGEFGYQHRWHVCSPNSMR